MCVRAVRRKRGLGAGKEAGRDGERVGRRVGGTDRGREREGAEHLGRCVLAPLEALVLAVIAARAKPRGTLDIFGAQ